MHFKSRLLGYLAFAISFLLGKTLRVEVLSSAAYDPYQQYLFAFWHGKQLLPVLALKHHKTERAVLVSSSRDGDLLTIWLKCLGYEVIRGSSRHNNISGLIGMSRKLRAGYSLGFGIDGPIGPIYQVKPGMTYLAQKFNIPIIPVGSAFNHRWVVERAWDKYEIPKPFAKAVFYLGKPFIMEEKSDLHASNLQLEQLIKEAEAEASSHLG